MNEPGRDDDPIARLIHLAGPRPAVPEERMARVRESVHARWREALARDRRRRLVVALAVPLAAALVMAIGAGVWLVRSRDGSRRGAAAVDAAPVATVERTEGQVLLHSDRAVGSGSVLGAGSRLSTGPGARAALRLTGGPSIRLDADTELELTSAQALDLRRGAVYVDTGARPSDAGAPHAMPLEIRTPLGRVREVGTQFEVRLAADSLRLIVREGVAALSRDDGTHLAPAGTRLRVDAGGAVVSDSAARWGADWNWVLAVAPPFELEGRTLGDYLDWLSRETGWRVKGADASITASMTTVTLHGSTLGLRPDETLAAVLPACGMRHRLDGDTLIIERDAGGETSR
jgi:FecR-like protein